MTDATATGEKLNTAEGRKTFRGVKADDEAKNENNPKAKH